MRRDPSLSSLAFVLLLAASAHGEERALKLVGGDVPQGLGLSLRVQAKVGDVTRAVAPGDTLHSGDRVELFLDVDAPAWVYVMQAFPDGSSAVLFPPAGELQLQPGAPVRVPPAGQWFQLDEAVGVENLVVVASRRPLAEVDRAAHKIVEETRKTPAARAAHKKRAAPPALSLKSRGLFVVGTDEKRTLSAHTDDAGVAIFRFAFQHER
jgi:hypothetical protein